MSTENISVQVSENNGATERLTAAVNALASAADRLQGSAERGASGTRSLGNAAGTSASQIGPLQRAVSGVSSSMGTLQGAAGSLFAALAGAKLIKYSDDFTQVQNKLRLVTKDSEQLGKVTAEVAGIARETRNDFVGSANVYARLSTALKGMNKDTAAAGPLLKTVAQAVTLSGSTAESAKAGLEQFQQSLNKGKLSGEEFNSVMVGLPGLAAAIAQGLGKPVSALKAMADAQQLTSAKVLGALEKSALDVQRAFAQSVPTVAQGLITLQSAFTYWLGTANEGSGSTNRLSSALLFLSDNMNIVGPAALILAGALSLGFVIIPSVIAIGTMIGALFSLTVAMATATVAFLATPVGWAVAGVVIAGATALYYFRDAIVEATKNIPILGGVVSFLNGLVGDNKDKTDANTGSQGTFADKLKQVHVELNKITGGFAGATKGADAHRGGIGSLDQPYNQLGEKLESTKERLDRLNKAEEKRRETIDRTLKAMGSAAVYSDKATGSNDNVAGSLDRVSASAGSATERLGTYVNGMGNVVAGAGAVTQAMNTVSAAIEQTYQRQMQLAAFGEGPLANGGGGGNNSSPGSVKDPTGGPFSRDNSDVTATVSNGLDAGKGGEFQYQATGFNIEHDGKILGNFTTGHAGFGAGGMGYLASNKEYSDLQERIQQAVDAAYEKNPKMLTSEAAALAERMARGSGVVGTLYNSAFATGGSFMVGGKGGTDKQPVNFMASPDERVTIETPGQQRRNDRPVYDDGYQSARDRTRTTINNVVIKTYDVDSYKRSRRQIQQDAARRLSGR